MSPTSKLVWIFKHNPNLNAIKMQVVGSSTDVEAQETQTGLQAERGVATYHRDLLESTAGEQWVSVWERVSLPWAEQTSQGPHARGHLILNQDV